MTKPMLRFALSIAVCVLAASLVRPAHADDPPADKPPPPCSEPQARQFDFWLGEWDLTWAEGGKGTNVVTRALGDCVVVEKFDGTPSSPLVGTSMSVFDRRTGKWRQTWVDNQGGYLDFEGGWADGKMTLSREAVIEGEKVRQRMVWYNIAKDSLDWNWERSKDGGKSWEVLWKIHYVKKR